jgi:hypothetical protein
LISNWPQAHLADRRLGRDVHGVAGVVEVVEEAVEGVEGAQAQNLGPRPPLARAGRGGLADLGPRVVHEVELELGRHDRGQAARLVALDHGAQSVAGITVVGLPSSLNIHIGRSAEGV